MSLQRHANHHLYPHEITSGSEWVSSGVICRPPHFPGTTRIKGAIFITGDKHEGMSSSHHRGRPSD